MKVGGHLPDCLADVADATYHAGFGDPPYGLARYDASTTAAVLAAWTAELDGVDVSAEVRKKLPKGGMLSRGWDALPPSPSTWRELLRVIRPGGLFISYSHARTVDLMTLALRLAGWEILPMMVRIHGGSQGKGLDISKALDAAAGAEREVAEESPHSANRTSTSMAIATSSGAAGYVRRPEGRRYITLPATPLATAFVGFNTELRNAVEPLIVARRPPEGTWAENASKWGVAGFNVSAGRIPSGRDHLEKCLSVVGLDSARGGVTRSPMESPRENSWHPAGRYPTNVVLEHLEGCSEGGCQDGCPVAQFPGSRGSGSAKRGSGRRTQHFDEGFAGGVGYDDTGSASRFFYRARASREERHRGVEHLLWLKDRKHPDGWHLATREEWGGAPDSARAAGNPHLAVKSLELNAHLASFLRAPVIHGEEPRLLNPWAGSGSEEIGALLAGWTRVDTIEKSDQWDVVRRARRDWWLARGRKASREDRHTEPLPLAVQLFLEGVDA